MLYSILYVYGINLFGEVDIMLVK